MQPLNDEIVRLNNAFKLKFKKLYLGVSNVRCRSCYPYPRLIYSLGNDGNTFFSDGVSETVFERGDWVLIPPFVEISQHLRHSHHLAIHFTCSLLDGMELFSGMKQIEHGCVNSANIPIRRLVQEALQANATAVVLAHNHPSGVAMPSQEDVELTERLYYTLRALDISLEDHLIIANDTYRSLRESGYYLEFC